MSTQYEQSLEIRMLSTDELTALLQKRLIEMQEPLNRTQSLRDHVERIQEELIKRESRPHILDA